MAGLGRKLAESGAILAAGGALLTGCGGESAQDRYQNSPGRYARITQAARKFVRTAADKIEGPRDSTIPRHVSCAFPEDSGATNSSIKYVTEPLGRVRPGDTCDITFGARQQIEISLGVSKPGAYNPNMIGAISVILSDCDIDLIDGGPDGGGWFVSDYDRHPASISGGANIEQAKQIDSSVLNCLGETAALLH